MLASIGGVDITPYIQEKTYKINRDSVYESWVDADYKTHREKVRDRIVGSFELVFVTATDFQSFIDLINNNKDYSDLLTITLYVSNINTSEEYDVFFEFENTSNRIISNDYFYKRFTMNVEEA